MRKDVDTVIDNYEHIDGTRKLRRWMVTGSEVFGQESGKSSTFWEEITVALVGARRMN